MIQAFRPWTHTSDDSYIYQLSLVVATATVSFSGSGMQFRQNYNYLELQIPLFRTEIRVNFLFSVDGETK